MKCDICKEREATVHLTRIINGMKEEIHLCENCANEKEKAPFSFQSILSGFMDYMIQPNLTYSKNQFVCENCGTNYSEFKQKGLFGCSKCYENFKEMITPVIKNVQGNIEHVGKFPKKAGRDIMTKKKIESLKLELQKAIASEEYEKAAEIRDKIRDIQNM